MPRGLTLLTMRREGQDRLAAKTEKGILDVVEASRLLQMYAPTTLDDLLQHEDGPSVQALITAALGSGRAQAAFLNEETLEFGPLVSRPGKIFMVGANYGKHAAEVGGKPRTEAETGLFTKFYPSLNRHKGTIKLPVRVTKQCDYETELLVVMGKTADNVSEADALSYVAGYAIANDFSARDLQFGAAGAANLGTMFAKSLDGFFPIGPYFVGADLVGDPMKLKLETRVNGEVRQSASTDDMVFGPHKLISAISRYVPLRPGDIISTGTPEGVILGMPKDKQVWLKPGDKIISRIEKLGELRFSLV
jgi:2-keto-4-pentenoate hydratase/2-oxohepta-3-ene-1,7-dioic acid hydratase in catechol pathway